MFESSHRVHQGQVTAVAATGDKPGKSAESLVPLHRGCPQTGHAWQVEESISFHFLTFIFSLTSSVITNGE